MFGIKWHWGTKITLVYIGFVVFMLSMVGLCVKQHFDLVTPDYYAQELAFQEVIDGKQNAMALSTAAQLNEQGAAIVIALPAELSRIDSGKVLFYKPDNARYDFEWPLTQALQYEVPKDRFAYGLYNVKITWYADGTRYFTEKNLFINP